MFLEIIIMLLMISAVFSSFVVLAGKSKWERLLGSCLVSAKINMLIIVYALLSNKTYYLDVALVYIILSYVGVTVLADFMVRRRETK